MPPDLEAIILKALAKRAVDRFQSGQEMHAALEGYLGRSGWAVGSPHLSEFMKKLFPEEYEETRKSLAIDQEKVEVEQKISKEAFVPWEPYENKSADDDPSQVLGIHQTPQRPMTPQPINTAPQATRRRGSPLTWLLVILLLLLIAGAGFILYQLYSKETAHPPAAKTTESGTLLIESVPEGADVNVNGKPEGTTPVVLRNLPFGEELTVRLETEGYQVFITPVLLTDEEPEFTLKAKLKKK